MSSPFDWYAPAPAELHRSRITLHFGLRADDLFYRQRVVPQAGRIWFIRQLSWALAALPLATTLAASQARGTSPVAVAHALEAVGSKLAWWWDGHPTHPQPARRRTLGSRAFSRDYHGVRWSFRDLSRKEHYVQNTLRQTAVTALRVESGLGLVAGNRYAEMRPVGLGLELAEAFLQQRVGRGGAVLEGKLIGWIAAEQPEDNRDFLEGRSPLEVLGPECSEAERRIAERILFGGEGAAVDTRSALREVLKDADSLPDPEKEIVPALRRLRRRGQALDLLAARAFGTMLDAIIDLAMATAEPIAASRGRVRITAVAQHASVAASYELLRSAASHYRAAAEQAETWPHAPAARLLADQVASDSPTRVITTLLERAPELFDVSDGAVGPGDLFQRIAHGDRPDLAETPEERDTPMTEPLLTDRTFNLNAFHALVRDVEGLT